MRSYLGALVEDGRLRGVPRFDAASRLRAAYLWNLFDPFLASAAVAAVRFIATGEESSPLGGLRLGESIVMPRPTFALTPFGPEQGLGAWWGRKSAVAELGFHMSSFGGLQTQRVTARTARLQRGGPQMTWGASLDAWSQPDLAFEPRASTGANRLGGSIALLAAWDAIDLPLGVVGSVGAKTDGFSETLPLRGGPYGWLGVRIRHP